MPALDTFLPLVRGPLPGCPEAVLKDALRDACIEFCQRTRLLVQDVTVDVVAGERLVTLYPDSDSFWEVTQVRRDSTPLSPINRRECELNGWDTTSGVPLYYYLEGDRQLALGPVPDAAETLTATVTLRPKDTATRVADALYSDFREVIAAGARAWVRRNHGEWSEPSLEGQDRQLFEHAIHNQNIRRARGGTGVALRVRSHSF